MQKSPKELKILGVKVSGISHEEVLSFVANSLQKKSKFFISTPNPEIIVMAQKDRELLAALNSADVALPDGAGLKLAGIKAIITGRQMFESLLLMANNQRLKVFLLGSTPEVNKFAIAKVKRLYPNAKVDGSGDILINNEGYSESIRDKEIHIDIIRHIDDFRPDLLFVALGAPKQEKWVYHNLEELNVGGAMVVGGALDYFAEKAMLPPDWVSRAGLEWLWRAILEPQRIKRIFNAVVVFPLLVVRFKIRSKYLSGYY
ncbi:hypothetical protein A2803_00790 [Candidatus Woesebacteria bacterium RIFCSPHIGHO2_01_FULL_44_21]|uniref:Uncharacterized protein n=1 Tax=Candidatus Woesebacteria bacterium RIFCSPHIGHO2_01_FULL_44_21 TaxID=1802503 RepID=A0A1F7YZD9_9BACT|nr:MAG: hypothetical protein A2803_00790 [Candidatus Woesebacteria bacterium RIFCSPHIGHO2_01_FULL_44_21]OGM70398.1 MAG: hypothetical protein A2897_01220 [Candidatus Woesebacteria bacterium RIFCSPLOWO2_01_FULL_44_24b]